MKVADGWMGDAKDGSGDVAVSLDGEAVEKREAGDEAREGAKVAGG